MAKITCATCEHSREYLDSMKRVLVCAKFKMAPVEHNDNCGEWFAAIPRSNTSV